jgi:uncharacterized protein YfbU (UPF0304 family)
MKYTQAEKLQISMLCEIYRTLGIKNSYNPDVVDSAISSDNYWALGMEYPDLDTGEPLPDSVTLVIDAIDMYDILDYTYKQMSKEDRDEVAAAVTRFDPAHSLKFPGFDGNNEGHYRNIAYLLRKMGRFSEIEITANSHRPMIDIYRRMLEVFLSERADFEPDVGISKQSFIDTLNAKTHPENR